MWIIEKMRGKWNWPPLESDPLVFQALTHDLLGSSSGSEGLAAADGVELRQDLLTNGRCAAPVLVPRVGEVLSFDDDCIDDIRDARALLVCYHNKPLVSGRPAPAVDAAAAAAVKAAEIAALEASAGKGAREARAGTCFIEQVARLDAACGIIGLVHGLLNADGLLGGAPNSASGPGLPGGPLCRWLDGLPRNATPRQRGCALVADKGIQAAYKVQAMRGQSRMPRAVPWSRFMNRITPFLLALWAIATVVLWSLRGFVAAFEYILATAVLVLVMYIIFQRFCGNEETAKLECHFICLLARGGRVLLFDGMQDGVKDIGDCGVDNTLFSPTALAWVRCSLLPTLEQPDTCAILAVSPPLASRVPEP